MAQNQDHSLDHLIYDGMAQIRENRDHQQTQIGSVRPCNEDQKTDQAKEKKK